MPEENIQGQDTQPPAQPQAEGSVIEWQGQKYNPNDFLSKHEAAVRAMNEAQQRAAEAEKQIKEYESWAPAVRDAYQSDPDGFNNWYQNVVGEGQGHSRAPNALDPNVQRLEAQEVEIQRLKMERELDNMAARGFEMTPNMRQEIAREIYVSKIGDVEAVYKKLYWDRALAQARENAVSDTASTLNKGRQYHRPPEGSAKAPAPVDVSKLSREERRDLAVERIKEMPFYNE